MTLKRTCCILLMACLLTACRQTDLSALLKPVVEGLSVHADYSLADISFRLSPDGNVTVCNVECTQEGTTVRTVPAERDGDGGYRCRLTGLEPETDYTVQVVYGNGMDEEHASGIAFRTAPSPFPPALLKYLLEAFDEDHDGVLSTQERGVVKEMLISEIPLENLEGLDLFPNLERLTCGQNGIKVLDVSRLKNLVFLACGSDPYRELRFDNPHLENIYLINTRLEAFDSAGLPALEHFSAHWNSFKRVDFTGSPLLWDLGLWGTELETLDLTPWPQLEYVNLKNNSRLKTVRIRRDAATVLELDPETEVEYI